MSTIGALGVSVIGGSLWFGQVEHPVLSPRTTYYYPFLVVTLRRNDASVTGGGYCNLFGTIVC